MPNEHFYQHPFSNILWPHNTILTHWGRDKMAAIIQTVFSNAFSWMKIYQFPLRFHWSLFLREQLTIFQHWLWWCLGASQMTSRYPNQWWSIYWRLHASLNVLNAFSVYKCFLLLIRCSNLCGVTHLWDSGNEQYFIYTSCQSKLSYQDTVSNISNKNNVGW